MPASERAPVAGFCIADSWSFDSLFRQGRGRAAGQGLYRRVAGPLLGPCMAGCVPAWNAQQPVQAKEQSEAL